MKDLANKPNSSEPTVLSVFILLVINQGKSETLVSV